MVLSRLDVVPNFSIFTITADPVGIQATEAYELETY